MAAAAITILDGGLGRQLQMIGAPFRQPEWSALALIEAPDKVAQAHEQFAKAGAQVISTNSYAVVPFHIGDDRFRDQGHTLADLAGRVARGVADRYGIKVSGSLPPPMGSYRPDLFDADLARSILSTLIEALSPHIDLWQAETLSTLAEAQLVAELLGDDPRPRWFSFTLEDELNASGGAVLRSGESITDAAKLAQARGVSALLFNCSYPEVMAAAVAEAKIALGDSGIRIGVYANGFGPPPEGYAANEAVRDIRVDLDPERYLVWAEKWVAAGATIVGGCCGIGPDHIAALARELSVA